MRSWKALNCFFRQTKCLLLNESPSLNSAARGSFLRHTQIHHCSNQSATQPSVLDPVENLDLSDYGSAISDRFNFAMYADKSPVIQKFIDLGVDLFKVEKDPKTARYLLTLSENKIETYLSFLRNNGVPEEDLGKVITLNPSIFQEDLDDLEVRVNYLKSKKFDRQMITSIITKCPKWLSTPVKVIDQRLGHLQTTFRLSGDQVRSMITRAPSLGLVAKHKIVLGTYAIKEEMGLDVHSLKKVILSEPTLLRKNPYDTLATYEYLLNTMKVTRDLILKQPKVLTCRLFHIKERHKFLESLGRAQYNHLLPGYVSLLDLVQTSDAEFCERVAKTSLEVFNEFSKTM